MTFDLSAKAKRPTLSLEDISPSKVDISALEELSKMEAGISEEKISHGGVQLLPIDRLVPFKNHPFKLYTDTRLEDMVRSIKEVGVLVPIIVRDKIGETYEILSGHNRTNAARLAGLHEVPAIIRADLTEDEASFVVTETNLMQRSFSDLSHSERAVALKYHMDAIKKQGKRNDLINEIEQLLNTDGYAENLTSGLLDHKLKSVERAANKYELAPRTVSRYIRLTYLTEPLLAYVDREEIGLYPAVSISYLTSAEQQLLEDALVGTGHKLDMKKAEALRFASERKQLNETIIMQILSGEVNKTKKPKASQPIKIKHKIYSKYFSSDTKQSEIEATIDLALQEYFSKTKEELH